MCNLHLGGEIRKDIVLEGLMCSRKQLGRNGRGERRTEESGEETERTLLQILCVCMYVCMYMCFVYVFVCTINTDILKIIVIRVNMDNCK